MSFLVLLQSDGGSAAPLAAAFEAAADKTQVLGRHGQVAFILDGAQAELTGAALSQYESRLWLIGRIRLDAREALRASLGADSMVGDAELCLRAYSRWQDQALDRLHGDFCCALWDDDRQTLLCARDRLGVRPMFFWNAGGDWRFADSIGSLRRRLPAQLSLDEEWIGDFLKFGSSRDAKRTVYREIRRFPAAHEFTCRPQSARWRRYWRLELGEPLFHRDKREVLDQFHDLLGAAIRDRLPQGAVGVAMSGGLDSSTLAAATAKVAGDPSRVFARTNYFEHLIPDQERHFSSLVAARLGVRHQMTATDDLFYDPLWEERESDGPEPSLDVVSVAKFAQNAKAMAETARVWFFGEGPDNALTFEWKAYLRWLWQRGDRAKFAGAVFDYVAGKRAGEWLTTVKSRLGLLHQAFPDESDAPPTWMSESLARHLKSSPAKQPQEAGLTLAWRPRAAASFCDPIWPHFFEGFEPSRLGAPIDWRHPYLDLRMLDFMLRTPPIPWARRKRLIREAMRGLLPDEVITRDKAPLAQDPVEMSLRKFPLKPRPLCSATQRFVNVKALPDKPQTSKEIRDLLRVRTLDHWLSRQPT